MSLSLDIVPDKPNDRRRFLRQCADMLAGVVIVGVVAPLLSSCEPSNIPTSSGNQNNGTDGTLFDVSALTADGQGVITQTNGSDGYRILIIRVSATEYRSLSMRCTHEGCSVNAPSGGKITCSCHGSQFDLTGAVVQGPASQPLKSYTTTYDDAKKQVSIKIA